MFPKYPWYTDQILTLALFIRCLFGGHSKNQKNLFGEVQECLIVAKITELSSVGQRNHAGLEVNKSSGGGGSPPNLRIWHIPACVPSVNNVGARHGIEWTERSPSSWMA